MMTVKVGGRRVLSVPSHTQKSISQERATISFHFQTLGGARMERLGGEAQRREQKGEDELTHQDSQARLKVLRKIFRAPG